MSPAAADAPAYINLSDEERDTGRLTDEHLFDAVNGFFNDGLVVLVNAIPTSVIDKLNERMKGDTDKLLNGKVKNVHWNQGKDKGNVSQVPPIEKEHMYPEIYANKPTATVLSNILGPRPELRYIRTNTLIGNTVNRQRVHKDIKGVHLSHPYAVAMNTCLVDTEPENGSTEVWLGTQTSSPWHDHIQADLGWVREDRLEARRAVRPPIQPSLSKGSIVLRDLRLWHAGMPNGTAETRVMLAFVYFASWLKNNMDQPFPRSLEPTIRALEKHNDTTIGVKLVDDAEVPDYLEVGFEAKFGSPLWPSMT